MRHVTPAAIVALTLTATAAHAQWPAGGKTILGSGDGLRAVQFLPHPSGAVCVHATTTANTSNGHGFALLGPAGDMVAGWPTYLTATLTGYTNLHGFAVDDSGNVWHAWLPSTTPLGTREELLTPGGLRTPSTYWQLSTSSSGTPAAVATGRAADSYTIVGDTRVQRTYRSGLKATSWATGGRALPISLSFLTKLCADGEGGVIAFGVQPSLPLPMVVRVDTNSAFHAGWPVGGLVLGSDQDVDFSGGDPGGSLLTASGPGHFLAVWKIDPGAGALRSVRAQRFTSDGTIAAGWPAEGVVVAPLDSLVGLTLLADGAGGAYVLWYTPAGPRGTHVLADGSFPPGLDASGRLLLDGAAQYVQLQYGYFGTKPLEYVVAAARTGGGLLVGFGDARLAPEVTYRVRWLQPDLLADPARPDEGVVVTPAQPGAKPQGLRGVQCAPDDGAYVAWEGLGASSTELRMTRVPAPVVLAAPAAGPTRALALSAARPNPARDAVALELTLAGDAPARLELLDVAGRTLRTQAIQGAGRHSLAFTGLRGLPPGLYFVRATADGASQHTRVVLTR